MEFRRQKRVTQAIWMALVGAALVSLATARWTLLFVSLGAIALSLLPVLFAERFQVRLPPSFVSAIAIFVFASIFLGEAYDFYGLYWWWDIALHALASVGFGLLGFLFVFMLFEGDRYAAPPSALAFFAFCFAMAIGAGWEIVEFTIDQAFGTNMQKSGLVDTMWDLIVDAGGGIIGGASGFFYLKRTRFAGLVGLIRTFIRENRRFYRKGERDDRS